MTAKEKQDFVNKSEWFQRIDLGDGIVTPGSQDCALTLRRVAFPTDLAGKTVLDIGANNGFFSLEAKRRGATRVVALDIWDTTYTDTASIDNIYFCRDALGLEIEIVQCDFLDYESEPFDVVLFMGVLYHLQNPLGGLQRVARLARELVVLETHIIGGDDPIPMARFYEGTELGRDQTNWWGPNSACVVAMMRVAGMTNIGTVNLWGDRLSIHARGAGRRDLQEIDDDKQRVSGDS